MYQKPRELSGEDFHFSQGRVGLVDLEMESSHIADTAPSNPLDDVFGSDGGGDAQDVGLQAPESTHPTDMSRLQTEHTTAGYREGVSVAKEASIQSGFDEGFSLGATIGQQAGRLLGLLEGISTALESLQNEQSAAASKLLDEARDELSTKHIFSAEYWAADGNWTYLVEPKDKERDVLFPDVAEAHPLIRKWAAIVDSQVQQWHIQLDVLNDETGPRVEVNSEERGESGVVQRTNKALDW
ncbi:hypothetical protein NQ176_g10120 [Zarea fungicola]|uniref:Uncharacterized protein n=1 Tax=Zarea fungicola TaxID=93591 RepID=A0ACC1MI33_9HYPO|nr:hypothetical protein NQ176_g10120 [Lecanicillium fungicola]